MKSFKKIILILLLGAVFPPLAVKGETGKIFPDNDGPEVSQAEFLFYNGRIFRIEKIIKELNIEGNIIGVNNHNGIVYYIRETDEGWKAGSFKNPENKNSEFSLGHGFRTLHKLICSDNLFYILADYIPENNQENPVYSGDLPIKMEKVFVRFDPDKGEKKMISGVEDFTLSVHGLTILAESGLDCNGEVVPLTIKGERYIDRIIDGRFLFVGNGSEFEVIDIISLRNIYFYREGKAFPYSPDYNVILEFNDTGEVENRSAEPDNMIYYQVNVNGSETGRTETAPSNISRNSMIKTEPGRYSVIKAERWELDKIKGRYVRVNNVYQPDEVKLYMPENRIIKIRFDFDGEKYIINKYVYDN